MICSNCGADIGDNETACPYCGAMQYENSEQKYMKDLYNLNEGMEKLDKNTRKYIIKSTMKSRYSMWQYGSSSCRKHVWIWSYKSMYNSSHQRKRCKSHCHNNNIAVNLIHYGGKAGLCRHFRTDR